MSIWDANHRVSIPKSTLVDRLKVIKAGKEVTLKPYKDNSDIYQKTFTDPQQADLYSHIKSLDSQLMTLNIAQFKKLVYHFVEHLKYGHRFNKTKMMARKDFNYDSMKIHHDLSLKIAE